MPNLTPGKITDQELEAARQRAAGRQKQIKKTNDPSNSFRKPADVAAYKSATKQNWARANEEARLNGAGRTAAMALAAKKAMLKTPTKGK